MKRITKVILGVLATFLLLASIFLAITYGGGHLQRWTADFRGETKQIEATEANEQFRMASYDGFYNTCASVKSLESKIINIGDELETIDDDSQRITVLKASLTASKNKRAELINKYNADARKEHTRGQFKASDLPYELNEEEMETSCDTY